MSTCATCGGPLVAEASLRRGTCDLCTSPGRELEALVRAVEAAEDLAAALEVLRRTPPPAGPMDRALVREQLARPLRRKGAGSPKRILDAWEAEAGHDAEVPVGGLLPPDPEPWPEPVDGARLLDDLAALFGSFVYAEGEALDALALWAGYTWCHDLFGVSPLLALLSPTMRCGKTSALAVLRRVVRRPLTASNVTPAALFRVVEKLRPTLLVDEGDTFVGLHDELRGLINSGWTADTAFVLRTEGERVREPRAFGTWCPKAVAAIGGLPATVTDRAIRVQLRRKPPGVRLRSAFEVGAVDRAAAGLPARLARWSRDTALAIRAAEPQAPEGLNDRDRENWRPLLAIADAAGGGWPERARRAALRLAADGPEEEVGALLLRHIREVFAERGEPEKLSTEDLLSALVGRDDGPWAGWWARDVEAGATKGPAARLAKLLKPFGIHPEQLWREGRKRRGYARSSFAPHWAAYIPESAPEDGRDGRDGRPQVGPDLGSTVPTVPTVFSEPEPDEEPGEEVY